MLCFWGCSNELHSPMYNPSFFKLVSNDSLLKVDLTSKSTALSIKQSVCESGCSDPNGYTGNYTLRYSIINRSFMDFHKDSLVIDLPFLGFKCPNSNMDFFYSVLKIEYEEDGTLLVGGHNIITGDIGSLVKDHISRTHSENDHTPVIEISVDRNVAIKDLGVIIYSILEGYYKLINDYSLTMYGKELESIKDSHKLAEIERIEPLYLRIVATDDNLYCPSN